MERINPTPIWFIDASIHYGVQFQTPRGHNAFRSRESYWPFPIQSTVYKSFEVATINPELGTHTRLRTYTRLRLRLRLSLLATLICPLNRVPEVTNSIEPPHLPVRSHESLRRELTCLFSFAEISELVPPHLSALAIIPIKDSIQQRGDNSSIYNHHHQTPEEGKDEVSPCSRPVMNIGVPVDPLSSSRHDLFYDCCVQFGFHVLDMNCRQVPMLYIDLYVEYDALEMDILRMKEMDHTKFVAVEEGIRRRRCNRYYRECELQSIRLIW